METTIKSLWARIILSSYRNLPRVISSLDRTIECVAMQGFGRRNVYMSTEQVVNRIIDNIYRKEGLLNLKAITDSIIINMRKDYVKLLELKYISNKKFHEIAEELGISIRTVFRYYDKALYQFNCHLIMKGFTNERLEEEYAGEPYLDKIKAKVIEDYRNIDENLETRINIKKALMNINLVYGNDVEIKAY